MINWTPKALDIFRTYCEAHRAELIACGADPDEVFADWQEALEERFTRAGIDSITPAHINAELPGLSASLADLAAAAGAPSPAAASYQHAASAPAGQTAGATAMAAIRSAAPKVVSRVGTVLLGLFAVVLPLLVVAFEFFLRPCATVLFDPMPTNLHALLLLFVPLANAWGLVAAGRKTPSPKALAWAGAANGAALGITVYYVLQFTLVMPFAFLAILFFGIGLVPLTPLLTLLAGIFIRLRLRRAAKAAAGSTGTQRASKIPAWWKTVLPAFVLMLALALPEYFTMAYVVDVRSPDTQKRNHAVNVLRQWGNPKLLLKGSYSVNRDFDTMVDLLSVVATWRYGSPSREDYQMAFYRVTGMPFNTVPPPSLRHNRAADWFDEDLGGDRVAAKMPQVSLAQSRLDGRIQPEDGLAYFEWTMEFQNESDRDREARALIELPPGGVVSRVTLWINDEPREAAFGGRSQTREAYQSVAVRQRRDPLLVTTAGPDRVLQQCFPIPPRGTMKTRIGITVPLAFTGTPGMALRLPAIVEQNFITAPNLRTTVWLECPQEPESLGGGLQLLAAPEDAETPFVVRGTIPTGEQAVAPVIRVKLPEGTRDPRLANAPRLDPDIIVKQSIQSNPRFVRPQALVVVVDGSARMAPHRADIEQMLKGLPGDLTLHVILANDEPVVVDGKPAPDFFQFTGGCDNVPALLQAAEWSAKNSYAPILWLHGAQPFASSDLEALRQLAEFSRGRLRIRNIQFGPGANRLAEKMADLRVIQPLPVMEDLAREVPQLLLKGTSRWIRESISAEEAEKIDGNVVVVHKPPVDARSTFQARVSGELPGSSHIVRLWAVERIAALQSRQELAEAVKLAQTFQLVTPVSGAVVLETAAQYKAHGLTPADPSTVSGMVPEPAVTMLLLTGGAALIARGSRRRRRPKTTATNKV